MVIKDSGSYIKAGNALIHEKSPLILHENATETAIEHGASLPPDHVGGVLPAQIHDDKLYKLFDTLTTNAPYKEYQTLVLPYKFSIPTRPHYCR